MYKLVLSTDSLNKYANLELGFLLFYSTKEKEESLFYFHKYLQSLTKIRGDTISEALYSIASCYKYLEDYDAAIKFYKLYLSKDKTSANEIRLLIRQCWFANNNKFADPKVKVINLGNSVNTIYSEYVPVVPSSDSCLFFTSKRKGNTGGIDIEDGDYFEDMYIAYKCGSEYNSALKFDAGNDKMNYLLGENVLNSRTHESVVSISYDEKILFYYHDRSLYSSKLNGNFWTIPEKMSEKINFGTYQNDAFLSPDGKTLFFTSNGQGTTGGLDIFTSELQEDGSWSTPVNIGNAINTTYDEEGPALSADGNTLYFASRGHLGYGGYDIYYSEKRADGSWSEAKNMGKPINSSEDDIYLKVSKDGKQGYFSSDRKGGFGGTDIYKIHFNGTGNVRKNNLNISDLKDGEGSN